MNKEGGGNAGSLVLKLEEQHNLTGSTAGSCSILGVPLRQVLLAALSLLKNMKGFEYKCSETD